MASISSSEVPKILAAKRDWGSGDPVSAQIGRQMHNRLEGHLTRRRDQVFPGFEGQPIISDEYGRGYVLEQTGHVNIGDGVILTAKVDGMITDGSGIVEIKPAESKYDGGLYWIQLALEVLVFPVKFAFLFFYKTGKLFLFRPPQDGEYQSYLATVATSACQIRDRQEQIELIARTYNGQYYDGDQLRAILPTKGEAADAYDYAEYLAKKNIHQRGVMEDFQRLSMGVIHNNTEEERMDE